MSRAVRRIARMFQITASAHPFVEAATYHGAKAVLCLRVCAVGKWPAHPTLSSRVKRPIRTHVTVLAVVVLAQFLSGCGQWTTYHANGARTGVADPGSKLLPITRAWTTVLDGAVYGQPLVSRGRIVAATERNTVYGLDGHDGRVLWRVHIGTPVTSVVAQVGCGNIDPLGITSTPVIDTRTNTVFVVAAIQDALFAIHHQLVGIDVVTGVVRVSVNADPGAPQNPLYIQQRHGLGLANGRVYIGYGGYSGDCATYSGWLVSLTESGTAKLRFNAAPHTHGAAIWAPSGPAIDGAGSVYIATGNPNPSVFTSDFGESVVKLDPTLHVKAFFSGSNATDDEDLGSVGPALVSGNLLFQIGKQHVGYLLDQTNLARVGALIVCASEAFGGTAFDGTHLFVPCRDHIQQVTIDGVHRRMWLGWSGPKVNAAGPPIIAGGALWTVDTSNGVLWALNPATGAPITAVALGGVPHFASPSAANGLLLVGTNTGVTAFTGPAGPPPHAQ